MDIRQMTGVLPAIIPGGISAEDFAAVTGLGPGESSRVLESLLSQGIGSRSGDSYVFDASDRLSAALALAERGALLDDVAVHLDWRSFEGLAAKILESKGFATMRNLMLTKPRMEIDVVGINHGVALLVDCKHWSRRNITALRTAVKRQVGRTRRYVSQTEGSVALPVIVTLYSERVDFIDRVPVVPIHRFSSFVDEFYGNLDGMHTIQTGSQ